MDDTCDECALILTVPKAGDVEYKVIKVEVKQAYRETRSRKPPPRSLRDSPIEEENPLLLALTPL